MQLNMEFDIQFRKERSRHISMLTEQQRTKIVNVSKVPHRSPFRYPGGKTWLIPQIRLWLGNRVPRVRELIEPFAGGGIVGLSAVFDELVDMSTLVETDPDVAAVWRVILHENADELIDSISTFEVNEHNVRTALAQRDVAPSRRAFLTILKNRVNRGGILAPGAGLIKSGENNRGLLSRWYPETLCHRIRDIVAVRQRLCGLQADGFSVIEQNACRSDVVFFVDPPYTVAGKRLYAHSVVDHHRLFELMHVVRGEFLMTYDDTTEIANLAQKFGFENRRIPMKNTHHDEKFELLIGRDLKWLPE